MRRIVMNRVGATSFGVLALLAAAGGVRAQNQDDPARPDQTYKPTRDGDRQPAGTDADREKQPARMGPVVLIPATWLDDHAVRGLNDDKLGNVKDLIISRPQGRVKFVLLGHGGVLKLGEKVTAVPYRAFQWKPETKSLYLAVSQDKIKNAPTLEAEEWRTLYEPSRADPIYAYFDARANGAPRDEVGAPPDDLSDDRNDRNSALKSDEHPILRMSDIRSKDLMSKDGQEIGKVNDLIMDTRSGRIAFVVVTFGGVLGIGEDKVPVPWPVFDVNSEGRLYAVTVDKEMIRSAPHLTQKDWGELQDPGFAQRVYSHYGKSATWLGQPLAGGHDRMGSSEYQRLYTDGTPRDISGTITSVDEAAPMRNEDKVVILTVRTDSGGTETVQTCPKSHLDQAHLNLKTGDTVKISGRSAVVDGKQTVIATQIVPSGGTPVVLRQTDGSPCWRR